MKKIISLFQRNYDTDRMVRDEVVPGAEWVLTGEGVATRKLDGTCCMVREGVLYRRHTVKRGKTAPDGFEAATEVNERTGKQEGWLRVGDGPEDEWHRESLRHADHLRDEHGSLRDGTYELLGPKIQGNPEQYDRHVLELHGEQRIMVPGHGSPFESIKSFLASANIEGIVWHHPDGRMVKIKAKDFGLSRASTRAKQGRR